MTEPRIEGSLGDLTFRRSARPGPSRDEPGGNFLIGIAVFIGVALAYPFYSYHVHAQLAARDMAAAMTELTGQVDAMAAEATRQSVMASNRATSQAAAARQRGVVVAGTTRIGGTRVVIVDLGDAGLAEATPIICRQAAALYREPLSGERLRVQRHRGARPAVDAGTVTCY